MSTIFSLSLLPICKHISLLLFISILCLLVCLFGGDRKRHKEAVKMWRLPYFKVTTFPTTLTCHHSCFHFHLQSHWAIFFPPHSDVQHLQPAVKLIGSTSFQGHTITPTSPALLHEYIEKRFPATLFHDWIPKDKRKKEKMGNEKGRGGSRSKVLLRYGGGENAA